MDMGQANAKAQKAFRLYNELPAFYTVTIPLGGGIGDPATRNTQLRPEPFLCKRISWATTADTLRFYGLEAITQWGSIHGSVVECRFGDSFTTFLGTNAGLVRAVFGDSNGFLELPKGILLQGSQPIEVSLTRLAWPGFSSEDGDGAPPAETRWDFVFHGVSLLPQGVEASGAAG